MQGGINTTTQKQHGWPCTEEFSPQDDTITVTKAEERAKALRIDGKGVLKNRWSGGSNYLGSKAR